MKIITQKNIKYEFRDGTPIKIILVRDPVHRHNIITVGEDECVRFHDSKGRVSGLKSPCTSRKDIVPKTRKLEK